MSATTDRRQAMRAIHRTAGNESEEPLLAPLPGPDFESLDRRETIFGWCIGLAIGTLIAASVILAMAGVI